MISGANEKELDLANARADILLMCGAEQLKLVDEYYENQINNLQTIEKEYSDILSKNADLQENITWWSNRFKAIEKNNRKLKEALKDIEELLLSEEQPVQPCNIRYDILEIIKKALGVGDKENES